MRREEGEGLKGMAYELYRPRMASFSFTFNLNRLSGKVEGEDVVEGVSGGEGEGGFSIAMT